MVKPTLVVLAAGMGSRYGGLKQIDPVGAQGEIIIDYSIYDAVKAGFGRVVFIINRALHDDFDEIIGKPLSKYVETAYVYQEMDAMLPPGYAVPEGRVKPWGTGQAILCCREVLDGPFAVINSDDYYGPSAFEQIYGALQNCDAARTDFSMVGYRLTNTLTDHGSVARGVCQTQDDFLTGIVERTMVVKTPDGAAYSEDGGKTLVPLAADTTVSMNFWGLTPAIFPYLEQQFNDFLQIEVPQNPQKAEIYIPNVIGKMLDQKQARVHVLRSADRWYGVTYKEDKPRVVEAMRRLTESGLYPAHLWA